jgi:putative hemolysin
VHAGLPDRETHPTAATSVLAGRFSESLLTGGPLGRIGSLEVRLARNAAEIAAAQEVRYRVFYDELGARQGDLASTAGRDADRFDEVCDHLLVFDTSLPGPD